MNCTIAFLLIACLQVTAATGFSQNRISVKFHSVEMRKALSQIEKKSNFRFLYNQKLLSALDKVHLDAQDEEVTSVLNRLFENTPVSYQVLANNLVVLKTRNTVVVDVRVTGKVLSPTGQPIPGVSVQIKNSSVGTSTDADGNFAITVPDNATLVFSSVGFEPQEVPVSGRTTINVTMQESTGKSMDEVVVIGYGTATKRDLTGSIVKVSGREVADKPNTNPVASLQGKVSGVSVVNSGKPGQEPDIRIRGTISRYQTKPLYVVDGLLNDNINFLNPADIESMEILKDPSSLAIFGVRGANGVIIVTTKRAKSGQTLVNFNATYGVKNIVDKVDMVDAAGFKTLFDEQRTLAGTPPFAYYDRFTGNSNWVDLIANDNAMVNTNNVSISSGTDKNKFYMGLGYTREEGLIKNEVLDKLLLNINDEYKVNKHIKVGFTLNGYRSKLPQLHDFIAAINATPIVEAFNTEHGVYNKLPAEIGGPQIGNPVLGVEGTKNTDLNREYRAIGSIFAEINFLKNFTLRTSYYADLGFNDERRYTPIINVYSAEDNSITPMGGFNQTEVYQKHNTFSKFQQEYLLTYKKDFGDHSLTAMGGFTTYFSDYEETNGRVRQPNGGTPIPRDERFWYVDNFFGDPASRVSGIPSDTKDIFNNDLPLEWESATVSTLFRALYSYKDKYLLNASFRRDGSSEISPDHRYQNFVAVGAAWDMTRENFMSNQKIFDLLKIKGSWGVLGNQYVGLHYPFYPQLIGGQTAVFGNNLVPAFTPAFLADPDLKWETVTSVDAGFEANLIKNRLRVEAVYYTKTTDNLLTMFPGISGTKPGITNAGKVQNRGIEASASWSDQLPNGIGYTISGNITTLHNEVKSLYQKGFEIIDGPSRTTEGYPIGYFYGYIVDGIYQSKTEKGQSPDASSLGEYGAGDLKFRDINGDNRIDDQDRTLIGNPTPDFIYGFSLNANYKGFDVGVDFQGSYGNEIFRDWGNGSTFAPFNYRTARLARWTEPGSSNWEYADNGHSINRNNSTYMIEDGSYLRLRNIQIGYNFNPSALSRIYLKSLRVFVNAQNLFTFKNNSGFTPEFGGSATKFGVDDGSYPVPAIVSAGINLTF